MKKKTRNLIFPEFSCFDFSSPEPKAQLSLSDCNLLQFLLLVLIIIIFFFIFYLLQNHWAISNVLYCHKILIGKKNSILSKWGAMPYLVERYKYNSENRLMTLSDPLSFSQISWAKYNLTCTKHHCVQDDSNLLEWWPYLFPRVDNVEIFARNTCHTLLNI